MNALSNIYMNPTMRVLQQTRQLPNGGGPYSVGGGFGGGTGGAWGDKSDGGLTPGAQAPVAPTAQPPQAQPHKNKYINPKTGEYYTPDEYANSVALKIPQSKATGDVGQYAGDALANPDASEADLMQSARYMNNARNDIATGTTDPFKAGKDSGIAYSPAELNAIEKAYAGIYDPAINDVFERLKKREEEKERMERREDMIFATNENIRQWRATTGTKSESGNDGPIEESFSRDQLNKGASAANMSLEDFKNLDYELANYFVNPPKTWDAVNEKFITVAEMLEIVKQEIKDGTITLEEAKDEIEKGVQLSLPVKAYLINQLPATEEQKEHWMKALLGWTWSSAKGAAKTVFKTPI